LAAAQPLVSAEVQVFAPVLVISLEPMLAWELVLESPAPLVLGLLNRRKREYRLQ